LNRYESVTQYKSCRNPGSEKKMTVMGEILRGEEKGKRLDAYS
jgi:hypothetical protein